MIINADARHLPIADNTIQCVVTSPPYFGLRSYGIGTENGEIGLEETPEAYVTNLVNVFREARRVMKNDATLWLNLGDSYNGSGGAGGDYSEGGLKKGQPKYYGRNIKLLKPKDLIGIPWMVAFALRADGWWLRSDIIWAKNNPMPESVTDRPTKSHEYLFLLTKSANYYYDAEAIQEVAAGYDGRKDTLFKGSTKYKDSGQTFAERGHERWKYKNLQDDGQQPNTMHIKRLEGDEYLSPVRNKRTVWTINTQPCKEAHYAVMPEKLVEPCILAGSKPGDIIFDPFAGSGTVERVAVKHGRRSVGTELNYKYIADIASRRTANIEVMLPYWKTERER